MKIPVEMVLPEQGVERINDIGSILKLLPPFKIIDKRQIYSQFRFPFEKFIRSEVIPPMILDEDTILMPFVGESLLGVFPTQPKLEPMNKWNRPGRRQKPHLEWLMEKHPLKSAVGESWWIRIKPTLGSMRRGT